MQRFLKKWGGGCKYNTTICYYFCVEKAIDTRSQRSSETFQKGGGVVYKPLTFPLDPPVLRLAKILRTRQEYALSNSLIWLEPHAI